MSLLQVPQNQKPNPEWQHYALWLRVQKLIYALPNYFDSEINIKGINVTDLYSLGNLFSTVIESNLVMILNKLRNVWDVNNSYSNYAFQRQSQTFPDVLLKNLNDKEDVIFGIELKAWYTLSKEGEPSFRYTIDPDACAKPDILVVVPWLLSEVISGKPVLLRRT